MLDIEVKENFDAKNLTSFKVIQLLKLAGLLKRFFYLKLKQKWFIY